MKEKTIRRYEWNLKDLENALLNDLIKRGAIPFNAGAKIDLKPDIKVIDDTPTLKLIVLEILLGEESLPD